MATELKLSVLGRSHLLVLQIIELLLVHLPCDVVLWVYLLILTCSVSKANNVQKLYST